MQSRTHKILSAAVAASLGLCAVAASHGRSGAVQDGRSRPDHGRSTGRILAFDNAISIVAARTKSIVSPVAGQANILLATRFAVPLS